MSGSIPEAGKTLQSQDVSCAIKTCNGTPRSDGKWFSEDMRWLSPREALESKTRILCFSCAGRFLDFYKKNRFKIVNNNVSPSAPLNSVTDATAADGEGSALPKNQTKVESNVEKLLEVTSKTPTKKRRTVRSRSKSPPWKLDALNTVSTSANASEFSSEGRSRRGVRACIECHTVRTTCWWSLEGKAMSVNSAPSGPGALILCDDCSLSQRMPTLSKSAQTQGPQASKTKKEEEKSDASSIDPFQGDSVTRASISSPKESLSEGVSKGRQSNQLSTQIATTMAPPNGYLTAANTQVAEGSSPTPFSPPPLTPSPSLAHTATSSNLPVTKKPLETLGVPISPLPVATSGRRKRACAICGTNVTGLWYCANGVGYSAQKAPKDMLLSCDDVHCRKALVAR